MRTQFGPDGLIHKLYDEDILTIWHVKKFAGEPETLAKYLQIFDTPWPEITYELLDGVKVPVCDCETGMGDFKSIDSGWTQSQDIELSDEQPEEGMVWNASSDGWDDMTEGGEIQYLLCEGCTRAFSLPEEIEYN